MNKKIIPVVIGLLQNKNLILIAKRLPHTLMGNYWEFPGGKVEDQENHFDALTREFQEELDIEIINADFLFAYETHLEDRILQINFWQINNYLNTPRGNEGQEIKWITAEEFSNYEFLPSNQKILDFILKHDLSLKTLGENK